MAEAERFTSDGNPASKKRKKSVWKWLILIFVAFIIFESSFVICREDEYKLIRRTLSI